MLWKFALTFDWLLPQALLAYLEVEAGRITSSLPAPSAPTAASSTSTAGGGGRRFGLLSRVTGLFAGGGGRGDEGPSHGVAEQRAAAANK